MAVTAGSRPGVGLFVRLKLRIMANGFRGRTSRVLLFVFGLLAGVYLGGVGFLLFAVTAAADAQIRLMAAGFGGGLLVLGAVLLPLIWFGIDDSLDPARMALLPVPRRRLVIGLFAAALVSVPAAALLVGTAGLLVPAAVHGGVAGLAVQAVGIVGGLLLCVVAGRAVTSAFAGMLRSRRVRDLAGILLACLAALIAPLQLVAMSAAQRADWDQIAVAARVIGWTPFGAPYTVGVDMAEGAPLAALAKLAITAATIVALGWWWSRSLESAMAGAAGGGRGRRSGRGDKPVRGGPVGLLLPRLLRVPATRPGAMIARELRYWWRDAKRRANLITVLVIGVFVPVIITAGGFSVQLGESGAETTAGFSATPTVINFTALFVGAFAASVLANQFGFDGTSYAGNVITGVPGRTELATRAIAYSLYLVPMLVVVGVVLAAIAGDPAAAPAALGMLLAGYGAGLAVNMFASVWGAYPLPEGSNPFAINTGSGLAKSLLALVTIVIAYAAAVPVLVTAQLAGGAWPWFALPVGGGYGLAAATLGAYLAGGLIDRGAPELLAAVTPRR